MTEERDEILDELRTLISIEPTAGFEARVRREVAHGAARRVWWPWVAAGVSIATVLAAIVLRPGTSVTSQPGRSVGTDRNAVQAARAEEPALALTPPERHVEVRAPSTQSAVARREMRFPEVLVPKDQAIALRVLMEAARQGQPVVATGSLTTGSVVVEPLPDLVPIRIKPLDPPLESADSQS